MSRVYQCKKCHETHSPPTGRKCTKNFDLNATPLAASGPISGALADIKETQSHTQQRVEALEQNKSGVQDSAENSSELESVGGDIPSTKTLQKDGTLQSKVVDRLSKLKSLSHLLRSDDKDSSPTLNFLRGRRNGKVRNPDVLSQRMISLLNG